MSFVYFYHKVPRAYSGGDLLVFDTDFEDIRYTTAGFTRVEPEDNMMIFFPSACFHSVVPVVCPTKAFEDSRFVINGHMSKRVPAPAEASPTGGPAVAS